MLKLIFLYVLTLFVFFNNALSSELENFDCKWDNKKNYPCVEIVSNLPNTSKYTKGALNRIIINKKKIEETEQ